MNFSLYISLSLRFSVAIYDVLQPKKWKSVLISILAFRRSREPYENKIKLVIMYLFLDMNT